jgi:hypothetical protein
VPRYSDRVIEYRVVSYRGYRRVLVGSGTTLLLVVLTLPFTMHVWKGWWDSYSGYSGVVVDKGREFHLLGFANRFLILEDTQGHKFKKYVGHYGYAFTRVGTFVVKNRGFGEYPRHPGEKTPTELLREAERIKAQKKSATR